MDHDSTAPKIGKRKDGVRRIVLPDGRVKFDAVAELGRDPATGRQLQQWKRFDTEREAKTWRRQVAGQVIDGCDASARRTVTGALLDDWLNAMRAKKLRPHTLDDYDRAIRVHLRPEFGTVPLGKLTPALIQASVGRRLAERETLRRSEVMALDVLGFALKWADRQGKLPGRNPMERVERPRQDRHQRLLPWDLKHLIMFLETADRISRYHLLYAMACSTGLRQGELLGLAWTEVDLDEGTIRVIRQFRRRNKHRPTFAPPKTKASRRPMPLHAHLVRVLRDMREAQDLAKRTLGLAYRNHGLVFCQENGMPLHAHNITQRDLPRVIKAAGVPEIEFRQFRNVFLTYYQNPLGGGASMRDAQAVAGHTSARTTQEIYVAPVLESQRQAMDRLGDLIFARKAD